MVACCKGFVEIVHGLHGCPFLDVNHQDNEGNTALMIASHAGETQQVVSKNDLLVFHASLDFVSQEFELGLALFSFMHIRKLA